MNRFRTITILNLAVLLTAGCSIFQDFVYETDEAAVVLPPLTERPRLDPISRNYFIVESPDQSVVGEPQIVFSRETDTFSDLAREYGLGYDELVEANPGIDPWLPGANTPILLPTQYVLPDVPRQGIVLNIASKRLFYYPAVSAGEPAQVMTFPIGIGRVGWETPLGEAKVVSRATDPTWFVPLSVRQEHAEAGDPLPAVVPPGPDNPLGRHVLKLDKPGYLLHGTNQPYGVGMRVSHGCVRLYPENIELLYSLVAIGEKVNIINEPFLAGWRNGELFFEAHRPLEDDAVSPDQHLRTIFDRFRNQSGAFAEKEEMDHAKAIASVSLGVPVRVLAGDAQEVFERARVVKNTVTIDPDAPTLAEVRELLEEVQDELAAPQAVSSD
ncbi:MAG TPA: L,D-transpeptidase family protein [Woeseiaceae bacterium]|nr:L,D-transpeptidase family protein [Woeseiaceae bacterium]